MSESAMRFVPKPASAFVTGAATVTVLEESKVRICYLDKYDTKATPPKITKEINFSDGVKCKIFEMSELPLAFSPEDVGAEIVLRVVSEGSKIVAFLPETDTVQGRFVKFYRVNGDETNPIPTEGMKFRKDDKYEATKLQFSAVFKIEGGEFDGKTVTSYLEFSKAGISKKTDKPYEFKTFVNDNGTVGLGFQLLPNGTTGSSAYDKVYELLKYGGVLEGKAITMPEDGNPLLQIEQILLQANKLVTLEIVRGNVASISAIKKMTLKVSNVPAPSPSPVIETGISQDEM